VPVANTGRTILVGEDELEVRRYMEMALKCMGYNVELAQDGDEVLAFVQSSRSEISAIVLDIMMPNRDGIDTLREIRRIDSELPVIMVSGASSTLNVVAAMKNGATDFLFKPVAHEDLSRALLRALNLERGQYIRRTRNTARSTTDSD
jgi:DNA-binding NtrC family response regulator